MKNMNLKIFHLLVVVLFFAADFAHAADPLGDEARANGKPLIADFGMNVCKQCIKQSEANEIFVKAVGDSVALRFIHVTKEADTASAYKILLIPTLLFIDREGKEVFRQVGYMPAEEMTAKARKLGFLP